MVGSGTGAGYAASRGVGYAAASTEVTAVIEVFRGL